MQGLGLAFVIVSVINLKTYFKVQNLVIKLLPEYNLASKISVKKHLLLV